jgi:hypothetical protein
MKKMTCRQPRLTWVGRWRGLNEPLLRVLVLSLWYSKIPDTYLDVAHYSQEGRWDAWEYIEYVMKGPSTKTSVLVLSVSSVVVGRPHLIDINNPNSTNDVLEKVSTVRRCLQKLPTALVIFSLLTSGSRMKLHTRVCVLCVCAGRPCLPQFRPGVG